ncbi:chemotaxis protein CheA [Uliginosibacterium aquaticum]|uniref:chemotaxis protein CheA n=1 Tax=Uliginosibacterium aquaticum TaxID=2731212 RepID=UPI001C2D224F|nr:chemotaxis protein CheA [Uliginosibacterium aquaticum]
MIDLDRARAALIEESRELLAAMDAALLRMEQEGPDPEDINAVFRAAHTIKGSAGLFGLELIVDFTHVMESVLVQVRQGTLHADAALLSLMFDCGSYISRLIDELEQGHEHSEPDPAQRAHLLTALNTCLGKPAASASPATGNAPVSSANALHHWRISLSFYPEVLRDGMDPLSFIHYLARLGEIVAIHTDSDSLPALADMDPECCYLRFSILLDSIASQQEISATFDFVAEGSDIRIERIEAPAPQPGPSETTAQPAAPGASAPRAPRRAAGEQTFVKVEARKLDELINTVGELVIAAASGQLFVRQQQFSAVGEVMGEIEKLVEQIRNKSLNLRMTPIGEIFQRFPRIVRDVSKDLGKKIELSISGAEAELDKSMIEKLADPLLHIVRNAIDHGIEPIEQRLEAGKPAEGRLSLNAFQDSGGIVIEVRDDGRGLNPARIRAKAIENGLIAPDAQLDEQATFGLIFKPGFSTAEQVTDLSGRGVGMDVVRRNIDELHGAIEIESVLGQGSTFRIRLPLTLAIIDCFRVMVGERNFVIPLELVLECIEIEDEPDAQDIINLRGEPLPFVKLSDVFGIPAHSSGEYRSMLIVQSGRRRAGILVDRLVGELQAVIKPLGYLLSGIHGLGGATILGDGKVALILDVPALFDRTSQVEASRVRLAEQGGERAPRTIQLS